MLANLTFQIRQTADSTSLSTKQFVSAIDGFGRDFRIGAPRISLGPPS
jgi:hypothetical protein